MAVKKKMKKILQVLSSILLYFSNDFSEFRGLEKVPFSTLKTEKKLEMQF